MMKNIGRLCSGLFTLAVVLALSSCDAAKRDIALIREQVSEFHKLYNEREFVRIYQAGSSEFREKVDKEKFTNFLKGNYSNLGKVESSEGKGLSFTSTFEDTRISISQDTKFAKGVATERFVYLMAKDGPVLLRYDISLSY